MLSIAVYDFPCIAEQNAALNVSVATQKSRLLRLNFAIQCAQNKISLRYLKLLEEIIPCRVGIGVHNQH